MAAYSTDLLNFKNFFQ